MLIIMSLNLAELFFFPLHGWTCTSHGWVGSEFWTERGHLKARYMNKKVPFLACSIPQLKCDGFIVHNKCFHLKIHTWAMGKQKENTIKHVLQKHTITKERNYFDEVILYSIGSHGFWTNSLLFFTALREVHLPTLYLGVFIQSRVNQQVEFKLHTKRGVECAVESVPTQSQYEARFTDCRISR